MTRTRAVQARPGGARNHLAKVRAAGSAAFGSPVAKWGISTWKQTWNRAAYPASGIRTRQPVRIEGSGMVEEHPDVGYAVG